MSGVKGMKIKNWVDVDKSQIAEILNARDWGYELTAEKLCMPKSTFADRMNMGRFEPMEFRFLCMLLGKSEEELKAKPKPEIVEDRDVNKVLSTTAILESIGELKRMQQQMQEDILSLARVVATIQKTTTENKAATELMMDDVKAVWNKSTEINSTVSKMSAHIGAKFKAYGKNS